MSAPGADRRAGARAPALTLCLGLALLAAGMQAGLAVDLPVPVGNNAVAAVRGEPAAGYFSFMGIGAGKRWRDITAASWWLPPGADAWRRLPDVPGGPGRLAAVAAGVAGRVYLFGGYTVDQAGHEVSTPDVYRVDPLARPVYDLQEPMPVPVDDTVAVAYQDRYVYLVSGWHDLGNVNLVQLYDTRTDNWRQATPWPGEPVFGHAGGIVAGRLVVCGGARVVYPATGERRFVPAAGCWLGRIDAQDQRRIHWRPAPPMPGPARYRAAAAGDPRRGLVIFAGGTGNPYNFDGTGYDGNPAEPLASVVSFDLARGLWQCHEPLPEASMDHRGLLITPDGELLRLGGMGPARQVSARWRQDELPPVVPCEDRLDTAGAGHRGEN